MSTTRPLRIGVSGARGRMGRVTAALIEARADVVLAAAIGRPETAGEQAGELAISAAQEALPLCDVVIDFSTGQASAALARLAAGRGGPALVVGSTGFSQTDEAAVAEASRRIAIVKSGNFSLGINLLLGLVEQAARALSAGDYDIEVFEAHHRRKVDAPSGTALMLGEAAARGRGVRLHETSERGRDGLTGPRGPGAIGFSVMRGGGIVGEHSVVFAADDEIVTLAHSARDRSLFARGAIEAARWVAGKPPGLYSMADVLGLK
jgi:4-hydroxy-tetrahydrodipicolinate reductase